MRWGEWDSVSCYACGLATIDPETDAEVCNDTGWLLLTQRQMMMYVIILATIDPETDEEVCNTTGYY